MKYLMPRDRKCKTRRCRGVGKEDMEYLFEVRLRLGFLEIRKWCRKDFESGEDK